MLSLSVSNKPCRPGRRVVVTPTTPHRCEVCGAPGGKEGAALEKHLIGTNKFKHVCPICHHCLHLDFAGLHKSGKIIWLPEISQENLNLLCLAMFLVIHKAGVNRNNEDAKALLAHVKRMYASFRKRAEAVETTFGAGAMESLGPQDYLSEPQHLASLMKYASRVAGLDERTMASRVQGMRFLPNPAFFDSYTRDVSREVNEKYAVTTWLERVRDFHAAAEQPPSTNEPESFDAAGMEEFSTESASDVEGSGVPV